MLKYKIILIASVIAIITVNTANAELEYTHTSKYFLKLEESARSSYVDTVIGIAGLISFQNNEKHGQCIKDWYYPDPKGSRDIIYNSMRQHGDKTPRLVILNALFKACGTFEYSKLNS